MTFVSWFGYPPQSRALPPAYAAVLWIAHFRVEAVFQLAAAGSGLLATIVKTFMRRPRPVAGKDLRVVAAPLGGTSFPSGHVLTYVGVYGWMAILANRLIRPAFPRRLVVGALTTLVAAVGASRVYLGHHWPSDVFASYLLGSSYLAALVLVYRRLAESRPPGAPMTTIRVLWNPTAGRKGGVPTNHSSREMLLDLLSRHGLGDELVEPGSEQEAVEAARDAVDRGYDVVVAAGGDGTIGLVGRQLMGTRTALGILPLGSVMNIPRMLGVPRDPDEAARVLADGHVRSIDVGHVGDHIFFEAGSVGMHAAATRELPKVDKGDYGAIVRSMVAAVRYRPSEIRIELDGDRTIEAKAFLVVVANGPFIGPGLPVAPEASLDDGLFDVRVFLHDTKAELGQDLTRLASGHRPDERRTITERASRVRITSPVPLPVRADSTDLGSTPVVFEIQPRILTVVAPNPHP